MADRSYDGSPAGWRRVWRRPRTWAVAAGLAGLGAGAVLSVAYAVSRPTPPGPLLDGVQRRGTLVVGVRQYARPAPPKAPTLPEPDHFDVAMARFLADRLHVDLRVVGLPGEPGSPAWLAAQRGVDVIVAGATRAQPELATVASAYATGTGTLLVLRGSRYQQPQDLRGQTVCVGQGSPYASRIARETQATPRPYASSIRAAAGFLAGECEALADDDRVAERLLSLQEWRFYRPLATRLRVDTDGARIAMRVADPQSSAWLDRAVRDWRSDGALERARDQRAGDIAFEASQLQDGLVCHS